MSKSDFPFEHARFHVESGPRSLFDRVRYKMSSPAKLVFSSTHVAERVAGRRPPLEALAQFDPSLWRLEAAEVRTDTGKFVNTTWGREVGGELWWVVVGYNSRVVSLYPATGRKTGGAVVHDGPLFEFVERINRELMSADVPDYHAG